MPGIRSSVGGCVREPQEEAAQAGGGGSSDQRNCLAVQQAHAQYHVTMLLMLYLIEKMHSDADSQDKGWSSRGEFLAAAVAATPFVSARRRHQATFITLYRASSKVISTASHPQCEKNGKVTPPADRKSRPTHPEDRQRGQTSTSVS